jgi:hypothetical protein
LSYVISWILTPNFKIDCWTILRGHAPLEVRSLLLLWWETTKLSVRSYSRHWATFKLEPSFNLKLLQILHALNVVI